VGESWTFGLDKQVRVVGAVPNGLPHFGLPQVDRGWPLMATLIPTAFAMFVVILAQSAATSRAYAARYMREIRSLPVRASIVPRR
jgi:SulP family sulfate permease